jgi:hypothetical protein
MSQKNPESAVNSNVFAALLPAEFCLRTADCGLLAKLAVRKSSSVNGAVVLRTSRLFSETFA